MFNAAAHSMRAVAGCRIDARTLASNAPIHKQRPRIDEELRI